MSEWMWQRVPGSAADLWTRVADVDGMTVVFAAGDLDTRTTAQMSDALNRGSSLARSRLVVDVSGLAFMDAAGLRVLVTAHNRLLRAGRAGIAVRGASAAVRRVFELTGFTSLLDDSPRTGVREHLPPRVSGSGRELENGRQEAGLSLKSMFVDYFALGGTADFAELAAHLAGRADVLDAHQRDVAAHALNERLADLGRTERLLTYAADRRVPRKGPQ